MDEIADMPIDADDLSIEVIKEPQLKNTKDCKQLDKEVEELKTRIDNMESEVKINPAFRQVLSLEQFS